MNSIILMWNPLYSLAKVKCWWIFKVLLVSWNAISWLAFPCKQLIVLLNVRVGGGGGEGTQKNATARKNNTHPALFER